MSQSVQERPDVFGFEASESCPPAQSGGPAWDIARLFPRQGDWTEDDYLALDTNRLVELTDGCVEVLPLATPFHQLIVFYLAKVLDAFVRSRRLGLAIIAPSPIRLMPGKMREPDVFFIAANRVSSTRQPFEEISLAIEVVSDGEESRRRDLVTKRAEYAQASIPEYWIVDPAVQTITVLQLPPGESHYVVFGEFGVSTRASSCLLPEFSVDVGETFAAGEGTLDVGTT
jgi:Uma2 family endonuclease